MKILLSMLSFLLVGWCSLCEAGNAGSGNDQEVFFGFLNKSGTRLLALGGLEHGIDRPQTITKGVCHDGHAVRLKYVGHQPAGPKDNGRDTAYNFEHAGGWLYELQEPVDAPDGADCFLFTQGFAGTHTVKVPKPLGHDPVGRATLSNIEKVKNRRITASWNMARLDDVSSVVMVMFEPLGKSALLSLVVAKPSGLIFQDYPGNPNGESVWRVDDNGIFDPASFRVVLSYQTADKTGLGICWFGAEGDSMTLLESTGDRFDEVAKGYLYQAPI